MRWHGGVAASQIFNKVVLGGFWFSIAVAIAVVVVVVGDFVVNSMGLGEWWNETLEWPSIRLMISICYSFLWLFGGNEGGKRIRDASDSV